MKLTSLLVLLGNLLADCLDLSAGRAGSAGSRNPIKNPPTAVPIWPRIVVAFFPVSTLIVDIVGRFSLLCQIILVGLVYRAS